MNQSPGDPSQDTSERVRRAEAGEIQSLDWVVQRFTPLLLAQARYRLGPRLRQHCDPEDVVNDAWLVALPRLGELAQREGRATPVLLKFLATTLLYRVNDLVRRHLRGGGPWEPDAAAPARADETTSVVARAVRNEHHRLLLDAIEGLDPADREILILRGIEQNANQTVAMLLHLEPSAVSMRFRRALERLRARLPDSLFGELPDA